MMRERPTSLCVAAPSALNDEGPLISQGPSVVQTLNS